MSTPIKLEVENDYPFQRRQWIVERIGWCLMVVFLMAGLTGVLGRGPLSKAEVSRPDGLLALEYERILRVQTPAELRIRVEAPSAAEDILLSIPQSYLERVAVQEIRPEPASARVQGENVVYRFLVEPGTQNVEVLFRMKIEKAGRLAGSVAAGNASLSFRHFIFP